ncbi:predicted protein [Arabidopsis lyrata subsp. lyrata]|uniref:Predicted protein n=1 Tax=Arabidopsis lyrata subsp. lyrata TaxID=81972 RepID=D7LJA9_ARALL|nr:predicted protein [Arabidopsis lyrata subsp. lyrata]
MAFPKPSSRSFHPEISMLREETSIGPVTEHFEEPSAPSSYNDARIKVIAVGGSGSNVVNHMIESEMSCVEFWIVNTDIQAMRMSPVLPDNRLQNLDVMGGGTGTGAAPVIAKGIGILTVGIDTTPFSFDGRSSNGLSTPVMEAFNLADDILHRGVSGISDIIAV